MINVLLLLMTLSAARVEAVKRFGPNYWLSIMYTGVPNSVAGGIKAPGCQQELILLGQGATYDAVFANYAAHPHQRVYGPFKGTIGVGSSESTGSLIVDGKNLGVTSSLDTSVLAAGMHTLCRQTKDLAGNAVAGPATVFTVDAINGTVGQVEAKPVTAIAFGPLPLRSGPVPDEAVQQ